MDADLRLRLTRKLMLLEDDRKKYALMLEGLSDCDGAFLRRGKRKNSAYYYSIKRPGSASYHYLGNERNRYVSRVKKTRFIRETIKRIDNNIDMIRSFLGGFLPCDPMSVNESLPRTYRCEVYPASEQYIHEGAIWLKQGLEFQKRFPENYPEKKSHTTTDEIKVKTVSELLLYESFKAAGLVQIYELPFLPKDHGPALYPDFTILSPVDMKTKIIVEFVGRLDIREYRDDFARRLGRYISSGYVPNVNLFLIFNDKDGHVDSTQIAKVIAEIRGLQAA